MRKWMETVTPVLGAGSHYHNMTYSGFTSGGFNYTPHFNSSVFISVMNSMKMKMM